METEEFLSNVFGDSCYVVLSFRVTTFADRR